MNDIIGLCIASVTLSQKRAQQTNPTSMVHINSIIVMDTSILGNPREDRERRKTERNEESRHTVTRETN